MRTSHLEEPELEFGLGKHIDIRFGLSNYGPLDFNSPTSPQEIRLAIFGSQQSIEGVGIWLDNCSKGVLSQSENKGEGTFDNRSPSFFGFRNDSGFSPKFRLIENSNSQIPLKALLALCRLNNYKEFVDSCVSEFIERFKVCLENVSLDVVIVAPPKEMFQRIDELKSEDSSIQKSYEFHDVLKAKAMFLRTPIQMVRPRTYDLEKTGGLQEKSIRAWNFFTALYYKSNGVPWRIVNEPTAFDTCYVGISFYKSLTDENLLTSIAQVFNQRGEGVIVRGGTAKLSKEDKLPHLSSDDAASILNNSLQKYRAEHRNSPARIVIHKSSPFNTEEIEGFEKSSSEFLVDLLDCISLSSNSPLRFFRNNMYPPLRGTLIELDEKSIALFTKGSVDFYKLYPGLYVPRPLIIKLDSVVESPTKIASEILSLTKMNWNNTQFDGFEPITLRAARKVSEILRHSEASSDIMPRYSYYM